MPDQIRHGAGEISQAHLFDHIKCEYLTDSYSCEIASKAAGFEIEGNPLSCRACLRDENPQNADNHPVTCLIRLRKYEKGGYPPVPLTDVEKKTAHHFNNSPRPEQPLGKGPGTELSKLLPKLFESKGCGCRNYAKNMNRWGVEGCRQKFDQIVNYLVNQAKNNKLLGWVPSAATTAVAARLVRLAIEKADKKQKS